MVNQQYQSNIINNQFAIEGADYQPIYIMSNGNKTKELAISIDFSKELWDKMKQNINYYL